MNAALYASRLGARSAVKRSFTIQRRNVNTNQAQSAMSGAWNAIVSRNFSYVTFIVLGAITIETIYGGVTTGLWKAMNRGVRFFLFSRILANLVNGPIYSPMRSIGAVIRPS